ncbi:hypothetical protein JOQ06_000619, partial [Pogonophryne albipinna]
SDGNRQSDKDTHSERHTDRGRRGGHVGVNGREQAPLTDKPPKILFPSESQVSVIEMVI